MVLFDEVDLRWVGEVLSEEWNRAVSVEEGYIVLLEVLHTRFARDEHVPFRVSLARNWGRPRPSW